MDRWSGILKIPLYPNSGNIYRVVASLCLSSSSKRLSVPYGNVIFFNGDRVEGTGNPVIERLSDPQRIAEILVSKFEGPVNAYVIEAPIFNGPFAVYKDFIPFVNENGEPKSYDATGFPASTSLVLLLSKVLKEAKSAIFGKQKDPFQAEVVPSFLCEPKTAVLGFSKGGTILNQLVTEIAFSEVQSPECTVHANKNMMNEGLAIREEDLIVPTTKDSLLNSIAEIHYVDVGLNSKGAYLTNRDAIDRISERLARGASGIRFVFHGTPRQWCDSRRMWIRNEKDALVRLLKTAAHRNMGKLYIRERSYFVGTPANLQMHFEIIEYLDVS
ncbi:hypothetical protein Fot_47028 [Forsythia ovata]|uniref:Uncharacterized protein n=1 Tax=Forsythia ovata TaxID=205694 RepID=A0ABD1QSS2_9LAMI